MFREFPSVAEDRRNDVIFHGNDSITFNMCACTGTHVVHSLTLTFIRNEHGANVTVTNSNGFVRHNVRIADAVRDLSGWLHLSIQDNVCWIDPISGRKAFDLFKRSSKGAWVEPLQTLRQTEETERYCLPVDIYMDVLSTMEILAAGNSFLALKNA
jgi:hypothetical protein